MYWAFAKYLATGNVKFEEGHISFIGQRMIFLPAISLIGFQKLLIKKFGEKEGSNLIYEVFKNGAIEFADRMKKEWNVTDDMLIAKRMEETANASGWGIIRIKDFDRKNSKCLAEIENSPFIKDFDFKYACNPIRGLMAGTLTGIFKKEIDGVEKVCGAFTNKNKCLMIFQSKEEWKKIESKELKESAKQQLV